MRIDNLTLAFKNKTVLKDIDISIHPGEFVFFIGYSGSGKTSLIRALIGDFKPIKSIKQILLILFSKFIHNLYLKFFVYTKITFYK